MDSRESEDCRSASTTLAQSMGGLYLLAVVIVLFVVAVISFGGATLRSRLEHQGVSPAVVDKLETLDPAQRTALYAKLAELGGELSTEAGERNRLAQRLETLLALRAELSLLADKAGDGKGGEGRGEASSDDTRAALLRNMEAIERELAAVSQALEASEQRISADQFAVTGLGARLNRVLLAKVEELQRGRSEFFARMRDVLGDRPGFRIEGDRFTLPSEVLFAPGSDRLLPQGAEEVRRLAATINAGRSEFPPGINWVLRVGGHTDKRPIANERFPSNWELSAMRAVTVVKALIAAGVPPENVAAAGFGEFHPVSVEDSEAGLARNRRIEFRLDPP